MVQIGHSSHEQKWSVMQDPTTQRDFTAEDEPPPFDGRQIVNLSLVPAEIPDQGDTVDDQTGAGEPPGERIADKIELDPRVDPGIHPHPRVHKRPLQWRRGRRILLVRVRYQRIVRRHHRHVQVPEILQEWRLHKLHVSLRKTRIDMSFNVPISVVITWIVLFIARYLDLFESPLRQDGVSGPQITAEGEIADAEASGEDVDVLEVLPFATDHVVDDFDHPVRVTVVNRRITVASHLVV